MAARVPSNIVGILLAAGSGSRFGGEKLLQPLADGVAIAAHAARNLIAAVPSVVAIVRWGDFPLYDMLEQEGCHVTMFEGAARGMGASLAHGIAQAREADGWVIALADMPNIRPDTIASIVAALEAGALIAAPTRGGERGHPVGFAARLRPELQAVDRDEGARAVLERHQGDVKLIECDDPGIFVDIDRREDLARLNSPDAAR
jgi:molybdenum cofactor cytidylyltransferase